MDRKCECCGEVVIKEEPPIPEWAVPGSYYQYCNECEEEVYFSSYDED